MNNTIYLDNNATTHVDPRVLEAMLPYLQDNFGNASSNHKFGQCALDGVKIARKQVADLIGAEENEIIFTSGATEAINMAIKGVAEYYQNKGKHIVTVATEHSAVLDTCKYLETKGLDVTYLPVKRDGLIELSALKKAMKNETILVSVMHVNNETGVIQPIKEISHIVHEKGAFFMSDTTQAVGKILINVDDLGIDLLCLSGHKMYAPKGIGALYMRQRKGRVKLTPLIHGGGQENNFRSGTQNVPGIVALGKACELAKLEMKQNADKIKELRDYLESELLKIDGAFVNGSHTNRIYNVSNITFPGIDSDALIMALSKPIDGTPNIIVSNGSACSSRSVEPSHVLRAMEPDGRYGFNRIRISLGKTNLNEEVDVFINTIKYVISHLRIIIS